MVDLATAAMYFTKLKTVLVAIGLVGWQRISCSCCGFVHLVFFHDTEAPT